MKLVTVTMYETADGKRWSTEAEAKAHERNTAPSRIVGLTTDQVMAALAREDVELADALEEVGRRIAVARRDSGDLRRRRKGVDDIVVDAAGSEIAPGDPPTPRERGASDFARGMPGVIPDDLRDTLAGDEWLTGWDEASKARFEANQRAA